MDYSSIVKPEDYFNTKLYTGNGSTQSITGVGFQSDLTWVKSRSSGAWHNLFDAVRGATKRLQVNSDGAESTETNSLTSFDSDGFSVGSSGDVNGSGNSTVAWNWKAGTTGSGTTGGSGTGKAYSYSVNTTAGFSIVKYAGNGSAGHTIPHHLGVVPKMIIIKDLSDNEGWRVYHASTTDFRYYLVLNTTAATVQDSSVFDNVPTSSGFLVGSANPVNNATHDYIAYCFAEKQGYSKFGSYVGNGNADGTFVYTGFKPAFVMIKATSGTENWQMYDNKRLGYNVDNNMLRANLSDAEQTDDDIDILSNGFKLRRNSGAFNTSGSTYIYMALAEQPLVANSGTDGVPATAR